MPAAASMRLRSTTICSPTSLPLGRWSVSVSPPTATLSLPLCSSVTSPIASSRERTSRHSMLWLTGWERMASAVLRWWWSRWVVSTMGLEELLRVRQRLGQAVRTDNDRAAIAQRLDPENELAVLDPRETKEPVARPELGGAVLGLLRAHDADVEFVR